MIKENISGILTSHNSKPGISRIQYNFNDAEPKKIMQKKKIIYFFNLFFINSITLFVKVY